MPGSRSRTGARLRGEEEGLQPASGIMGDAVAAYVLDWKGLQSLLADFEGAISVSGKSAVHFLNALLIRFFPVSWLLWFDQTHPS